MIKAYAAFEAGSALEPFEYNPGPLGNNEVEIHVEHCGICHSDLSMVQNEWGFSAYPLVPGHEVVGVVGMMGPDVTNLKEGQRVGLGWHAGYCMTCPTCLDGDHNMCTTAQGTIVGRHGGFADKVRAQAGSVIPIPEGVDPAAAGPLFCGGITVFNPFIQYNVSPTAKVGIIGIGGLGHLAVKFAKAWGCEVTAFTSSESKIKEALAMGAHHTINSRDPKAIEAAAGHFDLLISTVNVKLDWNAYLATLQPKGRLHFVGATLEPLDISVFPLIMAQRSISGSPAGSPVNIARMLEFAARHQISPIVEHFPFEQVNQAFAHLTAGKARYRIVLSH